MPKLNPSEATDKLIQNAKAAAPRIATQVMKVREAPTHKAARKLQKMFNAWMEAFNSGKIERGLLRTSLQAWQDAMINKGVNRIPDGLEKSRAKIEAFFNEWFPYLDEIAGEIEQMPDDTFEARKARMVRQVDRAHEFKRKG